MLFMTDITLDWTQDIRHAVGDLRLFSSLSWSRISTLGRYPWWRHLADGNARIGRMSFDCE
jgi:hypothetical protein